MDLLHRKCAQIEPGTQPLTRREIKDLLNEIPEWKLEDGHLYRRFAFRDFKECVKCVNDIVNVALEEGHFPDICISQGKFVDILLYTYLIGGLSLNDFILAGKIVQNLVHHPEGSGR